MIPQITFEVIDDPHEMIRIINKFLLRRNAIFDWSSTYSKAYPEFGEMISNVGNPEKIKKITQGFFMELYHSNFDKLKIIAKKFQKEWDADGQELLYTLSQIVEKEWPEDCKHIQARISLNPICPRFLDDRTFDLYWRFNLIQMKSTALHEVLHFIWFEKWKEVFPKYDKKEFDNPYLPWQLSEMVPLAILSDKRIQNIYRYEPHVYDEWKSKSIDGKPLLSHIQDIYDNKKSFADFMKKSWKFVKSNEQTINSME